MNNTELIEYYKNLLVLQYRNLPKARGDVGATLKTLILFDLINDVMNGFNIDDAVGVQLDVLGKKIGLERSSYIATDDDYRVYLKFKIIQNFSDYSVYDIDQLYHDFFPGQVVMRDNKNMTMYYCMIEPTDSSIEQARFLLDNNLLLKPAGVRIDFIVARPSPALVFTGNESKGLGFSHLHHAPVYAEEDILYDDGTGESTMLVDDGSGDEIYVADSDAEGFISSQTGGKYSWLLAEHNGC